jgi:hypothetical protein
VIEPAGALVEASTKSPVTARTVRSVRDAAIPRPT